MSTPPPRGGCARHLVVIAGLFGIALAVLVARNPGGVQRLVANELAMREGSDEARALETPEDLYSWIAAHPAQASLVVLEQGEVRLAYEADTPRPVAGLPALWLAAEWAAQAESGALDAVRVLPETLNARRLPGSGGTPDTAAADVHALVRRALRGDRAAESVLIDVLGADAVAVRARRYGADPPVPFEGLMLAWQQGDTRAADAPALAHRLATDSAFRAARVADFHARGFPLSLDAQRRAAALSLPRGSAHAYARLIADALDEHLVDAGTSARFLEPLALPQKIGGAAFGSKGGGFPGHLAVAVWRRADADGPHRVAVLVFSDLPLAMFYHLTQTRLADGLALRLLTDEAFLQHATAG